MPIADITIHPAIGIARVGNSDEFFIGPERPWERPEPSGGFKDDSCQVKRQGARFRLFASYADGSGPSEVTVADVNSVEWTVELANKKPTTFPRRRNNVDAWNNLTPKKASIHPDPETIRGSNNRVVFDADTVTLPNTTNPSASNATLDGTKVSLGELRTDSEGRLVVLGGRGESGSPVNTSISGGSGDSIFHNTGWYDDVSDGPVTVQVDTQNGTFTATAWVVVGPPKFVPGMDNMVTLYERLFDLMVEEDYESVPNKPSYTDHVAPVLQRARTVEEVTPISTIPHSWSHPVGAGADSVREMIFDRLRRPPHPAFFPTDIRVSKGDQVTFDWRSDGHNIVVEDQPSGANWGGHTQTEDSNFSFTHTFDTEGVYKFYCQPNLNPWGMKDAIVVGSTDPGDYGGWFTNQAKGEATQAYDSLRPPYRQNYVYVGQEHFNGEQSEMPRIAGFNEDGYFPSTLYEILWKWKEGDYDNDWNANWGDLPPATGDVTPDGLDRAALENCVGAALAPGVELGGALSNQPALDGANYVGSFRINPSGPVEPGDLTKYLPVPWQGDFYNCKDANRTNQPSKTKPWWPATRPLDVQTQQGMAERWDRSMKMRPTDGSPNMVKHWHKLGFVVDQGGDYVEVDRCVADVPSIRIQSSDIDFGAVPHGPMGPRTVKRTAVFEVNSPNSAVVLTTNGIQGNNISAPSTTRRVPSTGDTEFVTVRFPVEYRTQQGDSSQATLTVEQRNGSGRWTVDVTASTTSSETTAVSLVLDRSGSMTQSGGPNRTKRQTLQEAVTTFLDVAADGHGVSLVTYNHQATTESGAKELGKKDSSNTDWRTVLRNTVTDPGTLDPGGATSIGGGILNGHATLTQPNVASQFDNRSMVVLTDGKENTAPYIADVADKVDNRTFVVGFGKPGNTSAPVLQTLSGNHGGKLLITGAIGRANRFVLEKYFLQILSGVTNADVVLDPEGTLQRGDEHRIPFDVTDVDNGLDVILVTPHPEAVDFRLEAPNGDVIEPWRANADPAMRWVLSERVTYYRLSLPAEVTENRPQSYGQWHAILRLGGPRLEPEQEAYKEIDRLIARRDDETHGAPLLSSSSDDVEEEVETHVEEDVMTAEITAEATTGGVDYNLLIHAYSNLEMDASLAQSGYDPGDELRLTVSLTEATTSVEGASVRAKVTRPDGSEDRLSLAAEDDQYRMTVPTSSPGTYRIRVRARGRTSRGIPFQREKRVTGAVWQGGNHDAEASLSGAGPADRERARRRRVCELAGCLLREGGALGEEFQERLAEHGIDVDALRECLERYCRQSDPGRIEAGETLDVPPNVIEKGLLDTVEEQLTDIGDDIDI